MRKWNWDLMPCEESHLPEESHPFEDQDAPAPEDAELHRIGRGNASLIEEHTADADASAMPEVNAETADADANAFP